MGARALGTNQRGVLRGIRDRNAPGWFPGCGWYWTNTSTTDRICRSLVKRGLMTVLPYNMGGGAAYRLTDEGRTVKI